ncbi:MAG: hypothetical protein BWZ02_00537 [Lentisphaerae bacterium ADurb.BinA184]|nr:MAG: hypothetical protein BWZ02_00537 [Lentisphaerae bacterium ADurb.BinA184]
MTTHTLHTTRTTHFARPACGRVTPLVVVVLGLLIHEAGATKYWQGNPAPDGVWTASDGSVWQGGTAPVAGEYVYISNGGTATVSSDLISSPGGYDQLFVQNGSTLAITAAGRVQSTWTWLNAGSTLDLAGYLSPNDLHVRTAVVISSPTADLLDRSSIQIGDGGVGSIVQSDGSVAQNGRNFQVGMSAAGSYTLSGGSLTVPDYSPNDAGFNSWIGGDSYGSLNQSGGTANLSVLHVGKTAAGGLYDISGGSLTGAALVIGGDPTNSTGVGTFRVTGSDAATISTVAYWWGGPIGSNTFYQTERGTLEYLFDAGGVTPISLATDRPVTLGGTLNVGIEGGAVLLPSITPETLMTYGSGQAGATDFALKNTGVFTTTKNLTSYTAQLDPARQAFTAPLALGSNETFTPAAAGWFEMGTDGLVPLEVAASLGGSATMPDLLNLLAASGFNAFDLGGSPYNLGIEVPGTAAGNLFAWDFSRLDGVTVNAVRYLPEIPEPGTLAVLACGLGLALRRRRS